MGKKRGKKTSGDDHPSTPSQPHPPSEDAVVPIPNADIHTNHEKTPETHSKQNPEEQTIPEDLSVKAKHVQQEKEKGVERMEERGTEEKGVVGGEDEGPWMRWARATSERSKRFLDWCEKHPNVKVSTSSAPLGICPRGISDIIIHDIKVHPGRKGPPTDDAVYTQSAELRHRVARGNVVLQLLPRQGPTVTCCPLFALKKFSGGMGDEDELDADDDDQKWRRFFVQPYENSRSIVITNKENGAAGHIAAIQVGGVTLWLGGSKNVHMLVRNSDDIDLYVQSNSARYSIASVVMQTAFATGVCNEGLAAHLSTNHLTSCFELCDPDDMHVELFVFREPRLRFIAFTSFPETDQPLEEKNDKSISLCANPVTAFATATALGLTPTEHTAVPFDIPSAEKLVSDLRKEYGHEGKVLYFVDAQGNVIGLVKKKTVWYIVVRAVREKMKQYMRSVGKHKPGTSVTLEEVHSKNKKKIKSHMAEIQRWLGIDDRTRGEWEMLALAMNDWTYRQFTSNVASARAKMDGKFPVLWSAFLNETGHSDKIKVKFASEA